QRIPCVFPPLDVALPLNVADFTLRSTGFLQGIPDMPTFPPETLVTLATTLFAAAGVPTEDAAAVALSLEDGNLCGHDSHGVMRVPQYIDFLRNGKYKPGVPLTVLNETPAVVAADGNWGLGQVQAHRLLGKLIPKAQALGVAAGTLRNCGHIGR